MIRWLRARLVMPQSGAEDENRVEAKSERSELWSDNDRLAEIIRELGDSHANDPRPTGRGSRSTTGRRTF